MNEAETTAEIIDTDMKAARIGLIGAARLI
jgi:hypothetical protein